MTYCVGILLNEGLVMASDSRTNAGVDRVSTFSKMFRFRVDGERVMCLVTAGNLSITQAMVSKLAEDNKRSDSPNLLNAANMFEAAQCIGDAMRVIYDREGEHLKKHNVTFTSSFIFGGQIKGEAPRLFRIYEAGNFIEAGDDTPYFQIGETKYGKPILDRVIAPETPLTEAAKCALISFDSTMRSNISVGPPIDVFCYRRDSLAAAFHQRLDEDDPYMAEIRHGWGEGLKAAFNGLRTPDWNF